MAALLQKLTRGTQHLAAYGGLVQPPLTSGNDTSGWQGPTSQPPVRHRSSLTTPSLRSQQAARFVFSRNPATTALTSNKLKIIKTCANFKSDLSESTNRIGSKVTAGRNTESPTVHHSRPETFEDYRLAYRDKSARELLSVLCFFFLCRFSFITDNSVKIMDVCYKVLGKRLAELMIRSAAYDQFVAGEGLEELKKVAARLRRGGVASILCVPIETDEDAVKCPSTRDQYLDSKLETVLGSIQMCTELGDVYPMTQFRISALFAVDLLKTVSPFCERTTHNSHVMQALMAAMFGQHVDFCQLPGWESFPVGRSEEFARGLRRLAKIKELSDESTLMAMDGKDVIALIDAEYSSVNPSLRFLCLCLMKVCNTEHAKIFFTYQAYLKRTRTQLEQDLAFASANNFGFGLKLVRGAYTVTELQLARELGHEADLYETFERTSASYHGCVDLLLGQVAERSPRSVRFMVASHNEDSMRHVTTRMAALGIPNDGPSVFFGQLYGMADHVSFTLGHHGYRVHKSVPYGAVMETLPYLSRRAQENKAILVNARRERKLVFRALADRIMFNSLPPEKLSDSKV